MKEPFSTYTNLAFLAVAIAAAAIERTSASSAFIMSMVLVGVSSYMFHKNGSVINSKSHLADEGSIYGAIAVIIYHTWQAEPFALVGLSLGLGLAVISLDKLNLMKIAPAGMAIALAGIALFQGVLALVMPLVFALIAGALRLLAPQNDFTHGLWHIFIAGAAFTAWLATL